MRTGPLARAVVVLIAAASCLRDSRPSVHDAPAVEAQLAKLPLRFEANEGQFDESVRFVARDRGMTLFLTDSGATLALDGSEPVSLRLKGARDVQPRGVEPLASKSHYLLGSDPSRWHTDVPSFRRVQFDDVLPGITLVFHGDAGRLEYDILVAAGASPALAQVALEGTRHVAMNSRGDVEIETTGGLLTQRAPRVYERSVAGSSVVDARHRLGSDEVIAFDLAGQRNPDREIVIDPVLEYSTYLGGGGFGGSDIAYSVALDASGNIYVAGATSSVAFPTKNPLQASLSAGLGDFDIFVSKLDPTGQSLVYSTYLGGNNTDSAFAIGVDSAGRACISGMTFSSNFPTVNAVRPTKGEVNHFDAFAAKLNPAGSALVYSTYLGGTYGAIARGIAVDAEGSAYVAGYTASSNFPTANALQPNLGGGLDVFVTKLTPAGGLSYSTFLGGNADDIGWAVAVDGSGNAFVGGYTSGAFPVTSGAASATYGGGGSDAFIAKVNAAGSALVYATYVGGSGAEEGNGIAVDGAGNAYITGYTSSTNLATTTSAAQANNAGGGDGFVAKVNAGGTAFLYSTYLGGSTQTLSVNLQDVPLGIAVDASGSAYVAGHTESTDFPTKLALQAANGGGQDAFVTKLRPDGSLGYSTYLGGSAEEWAQAITATADGSAYVVGYTGSTSFPTKNPLQATNSGGFYDVFITKIVQPKPTLSPVSVTLAPRASQVFTASAGSGPPYVFSLRTNASGGSISGAMYTAGSVPNVSDVVDVEDGAGEASSATISIGPGVSIAPTAPEVVAGKGLTFSATGGSGSGYAFSLTSSPSGGTISTVGVYVAGPTGGVVDTARVVDVLGNEAATSIVVQFPLALSPSVATSPPRGTITFSAVGGIGSGYVMTLTTNGSGATLTGGVYRAGPEGDTRDAITVTDAHGDTASVEIVVGPAVAIAPRDLSARAGEAIAFGARGGSGEGFTWRVEPDGSGATIDPASGAYVAGQRGGVDTVRVNDDLGNEDRTDVRVTERPGAEQGTGVTPLPSTPAAPASAGSPPVSGSSSTADAGCACRAASGAVRTSPAPVLALLLGAFAVARRRRRP